MSTATPTRPAPDRSIAIAIGVGVLAVVVILAGLVYGFVAGGWAHAIGGFFYGTTLGTVLRYLIESLVLLIVLLVITAMLIYVDRKVWAAVQLRRGPNVVGPGGCCRASPTC